MSSHQRRGPSLSMLFRPRRRKEADLCDGVIPRSWEIKSDWQVGAIPKNDRLSGLSKRKNIRNSLDLESLN